MEVYIVSTRLTSLLSEVLLQKLRLHISFVCLLLMVILSETTHSLVIMSL